MKSICTKCHEIFNSMAGFDGHRVGSFGSPIYRESATGKTREIVAYTPPKRRCLTPDEMLAKGWSKNERGWWITENRDSASIPDDEELKEEAALP